MQRGLRSEGHLAGGVVAWEEPQRSPQLSSPVILASPPTWTCPINQKCGNTSEDHPVIPPCRAHSPSSSGDVSFCVCISFFPAEFFFIKSAFGSKTKYNILTQQPITPREHIYQRQPRPLCFPHYRRSCWRHPPPISVMHRSLSPHCPLRFPHPSSKQFGWKDDPPRQDPGAVIAVIAPEGRLLCFPKPDPRAPRSTLGKRRRERQDAEGMQMWIASRFHFALAFLIKFQERLETTTEIKALLGTSLKN